MAYYPSDEVLRAVGRVTVAASRLDRSLSQLWATLDRTLPGTTTRSVQGARIRGCIEALARERLDDGRLQDDIIATLEEAKEVTTRRNALVHGEWIIVGPRLVLDGDGRPLGLKEQVAHQKQWRDSAQGGTAQWRELPSRSWALTPPRSVPEVLDDLSNLTGELERLQREVEDLAGTVARARDLGDPPGWKGPPAPPESQRLIGKFTVDGLVLEDEAGGQRSVLPLEDSDSQPGTTGELNGGHRFYPVLSWCERKDGGELSSRFLDRALDRHGWHRVAPWVDDGESSMTTVDQIAAR